MGRKRRLHRRAPLAGGAVLCRNGSKPLSANLRLGGKVGLDNDSERFVDQQHWLEPRLPI